MTEIKITTENIGWLGMGFGFGLMFMGLVLSVSHCG
jgi:hypothetical protein